MILFFAFGVLAVAVVLGLGLAALHLHPSRGSAPWQLGALHGLIGGAGLVLLVLSLGGPERGTIYGIGSFGVIAAVVIGLAFLAGLLILRKLRRGAHPVVSIGAHALIAIFGFVILAAYVLVG